MPCNFSFHSVSQLRVDFVDFRISCFAIRTQIVVERCCCCCDCGYARANLCYSGYSQLLSCLTVSTGIGRLWKGLMDDAKGDLMAIGSASSQNKQWNWRRWRHEGGMWMWPLIDFVRMERSRQHILRNFCGQVVEWNFVYNINRMRAIHYH